MLIISFGFVFLFLKKENRIKRKATTFLKETDVFSSPIFFISLMLCGSFLIHFILEDGISLVSFLFLHCLLLAENHDLARKCCFS